MSDEMNDSGSTSDDFDIPDSPQVTAADATGAPPASDSPGGTAGSDSGDPSASVPAAESGTGTESNLPPEITDRLRRENLRIVPGETYEAANARLLHHYDRKAANFYADLRAKEESRAAREEQFRQSFEPIIRDYYQRQQREQLELQQAQIPDRETQPEEYQIWLQEQTLLELQRREQMEYEHAAEQARLQQEYERAAYVGSFDSAGWSKVQAGLGLIPGTQPDPDFALAYEVYSESALEAARHYFPTADDGQIQEFIALSQQLDVRRAEMNGQDIRDVMKSRMNAMIDGLVRRGRVTRAQAAEMQVPVGQGQGQSPSQNGQGQQRANGNGQGNGQARTQPQPRPTTVAQQTSAASAAANRRAPLSTPGTTRPSPLPGQMPDAAGMDEDEYVEATLAGMFGNEEQRAAPHRRQR